MGLLLSGFKSWGLRHHTEVMVLLWQPAVWFGATWIECHVYSLHPISPSTEGKLFLRSCQVPDTWRLGSCTQVTGSKTYCVQEGNKIGTETLGVFGTGETAAYKSGCAYCKHVHKHASHWLYSIQAYGNLRTSRTVSLLMPKVRGRANNIVFLNSYASLGS